MFSEELAFPVFFWIFVLSNTIFWTAHFASCLSVMKMTPLILCCSLLFCQFIIKSFYTYLFCAQCLCRGWRTTFRTRGIILRLPSLVQVPAGLSCLPLPVWNCWPFCFVISLFPGCFVCSEFVISWDLRWHRERKLSFLLTGTKVILPGQIEDQCAVVLSLHYSCK